MTRPLVAIRSVSKNFGEFQALKQVSLDVWSGEVLCLIGASGSGKTTLLRCINQLTSVDSGGIWLDGELLGQREESGRLHRLTPQQIARQRLKTGMVFQRFNLFPHKTALENITEGPVQVQGRKREDARAEAMELLRRVGLAAKADAYPAQLFAREVADNVVYMDHGAIVESGPAADVLGAPREARTQSFLSAVI